MHINYDIGKKAVVHGGRKKWQTVAGGKAEILYLDLVDSDKQVATMLMRMSQKAILPQEVLAGGKEVLVLEGHFLDERGEYPTGSYMRFPPGCKQEPYSDAGGLLFIKTWQFSAKDRVQVNIDGFGQSRKLMRSRPGVTVQKLYGDSREDVRIEHWAANHHIEVRQCNGLEVLVLSGSFHEPSTVYDKLSWVRMPPDEPLKAIVGDKGAKVLIKESHLVHEVPGRPAWRDAAG